MIGDSYKRTPVCYSSGSLIKLIAKDRSTQRIGEVHPAIVGTPADPVGYRKSAVDDFEGEVSVHPEQNSVSIFRIFLIHRTDPEPSLRVDGAIVKTNALLIGKRTDDDLWILIGFPEGKAIAQSNNPPATRAGCNKRDQVMELKILRLHGVRIKAVNLHLPDIGPVERLFGGYPDWALAELILNSQYLHRCNLHIAPPADSWFLAIFQR